jgi:thiamine-monophosphate kinase
MTEQNNQRTDVNTLGEFGLIKHLTKDLILKNKSSIKGVGDDGAVIDYGNKQTVISTDLLTEGIHFDLMYTPLKHLGYKSVVVNLSDIYAMNATPRQITYSIAISNRFSVEALEELYEGVKAACEFYQIDLIGGDTTSSTKGLVISVTAIGEVDPEKVVCRNTAKPGDIIAVTGDLGAAYLGLQILEREKQLFLSDPDIKPELEDQSHLIGKQLKPEARSDIFKYFAQVEFLPTAMIDISDGLASELFHICTQSKVGAYIEEKHIPIHPDTEKKALDFNMDPITAALNGGEDYELLFCFDPMDLEKVRTMPDVSILGEITIEDQGVTLHTNSAKIHPLQAQGWNHFSDKF